MPMYEYRCRACGDTFDRLRPAAEADQATTCACGSQDTARLPSMIARRSPAGTDLPVVGGSTTPSGGGCCGGGCCA